MLEYSFFFLTLLYAQCVVVSGDQPGLLLVVNGVTPSAMRSAEHDWLQMLTSFCACWNSPLRLEKCADLCRAIHPRGLRS